MSTYYIYKCYRCGRKVDRSYKMTKVKPVCVFCRKEQMKLRRMISKYEWYWKCKCKIRQSSKEPICFDCGVLRKDRVMYRGKLTKKLQFSESKVKRAKQ